MHVYAKSTTVVGTRGGGTTRLVEGEVWSSHDPVVQDNPDLFADEPTKVRGKKADPPVEEATAAPGAKRSTKRTTK